MVVALSNLFINNDVQWSFYVLFMFGSTATKKRLMWAGGNVRVVRDPVVL